MQAVVYTRYGPPEVLQIKEVPKPSPKAHELLVKVRATTVTIGDVIMRSFKLPTPRWQWIFARLYLGVRGPRRTILGMELAGDVEAVGPAVTRFKVGDAVMVSTFKMDFGGYAEYKCVPEKGVAALKPANLTYEEAAAAIGGGMTALHCLNKAAIKAGQSVLIYGASGAVGTNAVQIAKSFGAEVTGVCSTRNLELVQSLGADHVLDYTQGDFTQGGATYDVVFDAVGKLPPARARQILRDKGAYFNVLGRESEGGDNLKTLLALKDLIEGQQVKPVIDRCYPLDQIVEAHRYVEIGHKRGNVAITVGHGDGT